MGKSKKEKQMESKSTLESHNDPRKTKFSYRFFKRLFDFSSAILLFLVLIPLFLILSIFVLFSSKGPIIFGDKRVGYHGKILIVLKFRTMFIDSESNPRKYLNDAQMKEWITERKVKDDPRITKFGKFLRKTSLDELPQLFNIISGGMSVVGPRPITKNELLSHYSLDEQSILLSAKPGLTGNWQVNGRSDADYTDGKRAKLELDYFSKRSLSYDLLLLLKTIPAVVSHKGAK